MILYILFFIIPILIIILLKKKKIESFMGINPYPQLKNYYPPFRTNIYNLSPMQVTTLNTHNCNNIKPIYYYPKHFYQKPWYIKWNNNSNNFYCFIDKHLNRKCIWNC